MAYAVHFACDRCGRFGGAWVNRTVSLSIATELAREYGWEVGKRGWICPSCQNKKAEKSGERSVKKRKYYRKCGICGERFEQSDMVRTDESPNGWLCVDCHMAQHLEYDEEG